MKRFLFFFILFCFVFLMVPFLIAQLFPKAVPTSAPVSFSPPEAITVYQTKTGDIIEIPLEEWVAKILTQDGLPDAPDEAWKALAVAVRSFLLNKLSAPTHTNAMLCDDGEHCVNLSASSSSSRANQAAADTAGEYLSFQNLPAKTCYFHVSAGKTESSLNVWGVDIPYLTSVESKWDSRASKYQSKVFYPIQAFKTALNGSKKEDMQKTPIGEIIRSDAGHVKEMILYGTSFTGQELKNLFHLNSTNFSLSLQGEEAVFEVTGDGHGVGMSKFGAKCMAESGSDYQEILAHYYPGTMLQKKH